MSDQQPHGESPLWGTAAPGGQAAPAAEDNRPGGVTHRPEKLKDQLLTRMNRIEGQVRGVRGMIERDAYCDDILHQVAAVQSALNSVSRLVLENHVKSCLINRVQAGEMEVVDELLVTIGKMM